MEQNKWKVGILTPRKKSSICYQILEEAGCELVYGKSLDDFPKYKYSEQELVDLFSEVDGIVVGGRDKVTRYLLERTPNLKVVSKSSIGVDNIDIEAATENGILVTNAPIPENYLSVAEGTITLMLAVLKHVRILDQNTRAGKWRDKSLFPRLLMGKTVGLIGFGRIGKAVVERLQGWDVQILVYDPFISKEQILAVGATPVGLQDLLLQADIVSIHVVLTEETYHLLDRKHLQLLKPTSIVINTSRGEVIEERALLELLQNGAIAGAGLDVFEEEPASHVNPLFQLENVVVTPHGISLAEETIYALAAATANECLTGLKGEVPKYLKNPSVVPKWQERINT